MKQSPKILPPGLASSVRVGVLHVFPTRSSITTLGMCSAVLLLLAACGRESEQTKPEQTKPEQTVSGQTPYGSLREVEDYLVAVKPFIQEVGTVQQQYEQGLASAGSSPELRRGTGQNLADAASAIRPRLQNLLEEFGKIEPPPLLAPFHRNTKKMMVARLEAYGATISGWGAEKSGESDSDALYRRAEAELEKANTLILQLNGEMQRINAAVQSAKEAEGQASS